MSSLRTAAALAVLLAASAASAQVVKCRGADGRVTYSDGPCAAGAPGQAVNVQGNVLDGAADRAAAAELRRAEAQTTAERQMQALMQNPPQQCRFKHFQIGDRQGKVLADNAKRECIQNLQAEKNGQPTSDRHYRMWRDHYDSERADRNHAITQSQIQQMQNENSFRTYRCTPNGIGGATCR